MKSILWSVAFLLIAGFALHAAPDGPASAEKAMRLVFKAYDGNPKKTDHYEKFAFQIDTIDLRQPSEFLKLGDMIPRTKLSW